MDKRFPYWHCGFSIKSCFWENSQLLQKKIQNHPFYTSSQIFLFREEGRDLSQERTCQMNRYLGKLKGSIPKDESAGNGYFELISSLIMTHFVPLLCEWFKDSGFNNKPSFWRGILQLRAFFYYLGIKKLVLQLHSITSNTSCKKLRSNFLNRI